MKRKDPDAGIEVQSGVSNASNVEENKKRREEGVRRLAGGGPGWLTLLTMAREQPTPFLLPVKR